ncbi:hypothetical protein BX666DRAFT_1886278 [Dichotomocladium elegans]|nr:hypothetical protein BX666DRAFT_1886278 [Dichotomocladium elegans]
MHPTAPILPILGMLAAISIAAPIDKPLPYSIISPCADSTIFAGRATAISWVPGEEDHISIDLSPAASTATGPAISVAQDVSSANGTYIISVPDVPENCAQWKIGVTRSNESVWSGPIYISTNGTSCYAPAITTEAPRPSATMAAEQVGGPIMSASIDILGPDGQPLEKSSSAGSINCALFDAPATFALGVLATIITLAF